KGRRVRSPRMTRPSRRTRIRAPERGAPADRLIRAIERGSAQVAVMGLGYVGLPLACEFAAAGLSVTGIDIDARKVRGIRRGRSHVQAVPHGTIADLVARGRLSATTDAGVLGRADAVVICVPTPLRKTRDPDISYIVESVEAIAARMHRGLLVVLESTTYPG